MTVDGALMHALACAYAGEKTQARLEAALHACLPLCALIARRFSGRGAEYDDLFQTASMACVNALNGFDPEKGFRFTTYVTPTVTGAVRNYLRDQAGALRTPRALRQKLAALQKAREAYVAVHHDEPSPRALAQALGWDVSAVLGALAAREAGNVRSLSSPETDGEAPLEERLAAWETGFERLEQREDLKAALSGLTEAEKELLRLRFSLRLNQRETARRMGRTQMQISRMERRLLSALRKEMDPEA